MAYCLYSDVTEMFKDFTISTNTKVTTSEIMDIISRKDAYIDSRLQDIYTVPITGTNALLVVKDISIKLAAVEVWARMHPANLKENETDWATRWGSHAERMLDRIVKGDLELSDATQVNVVEREKSTLLDSGVDNLASTDDGYEPMYKIGDVF